MAGNFFDQRQGNASPWGRSISQQTSDRWMNSGNRGEPIRREHMQGDQDRLRNQPSMRRDELDGPTSSGWYGGDDFREGTATNYRAETDMRAVREAPAKKLKTQPRYEEMSDSVFQNELKRRDDSQTRNREMDYTRDGVGGPYTDSSWDRSDHITENYYHKSAKGLGDVDKDRNTMQYEEKLQGRQPINFKFISKNVVNPSTTPVASTWSKPVPAGAETHIIVQPKKKKAGTNPNLSGGPVKKKIPAGYSDSELHTEPRQEHSDRESLYTRRPNRADVQLWSTVDDEDRPVGNLDIYRMRMEAQPMQSEQMEFREEGSALSLDKRRLVTRALSVSSIDSDDLPYDDKRAPPQHSSVGGHNDQFWGDLNKRSTGDSHARNSISPQRESKKMDAQTLSSSIGDVLVESLLKRISQVDSGSKQPIVNKEGKSANLAQQLMNLLSNASTDSRKKEEPKVNLKSDRTAPEIRSHHGETAVVSESSSQAIRIQTTNPVPQPVPPPVPVNNVVSTGYYAVKDGLPAPVQYPYAQQPQLPAQPVVSQAEYQYNTAPVAPPIQSQYVPQPMPPTVMIAPITPTPVLNQPLPSMSIPPWAVPRPPVPAQFPNFSAVQFAPPVQVLPSGGVQFSSVNVHNMQDFNSRWDRQKFQAPVPAKSSKIEYVSAVARSQHVSTPSVVSSRNGRSSRSSTSRSSQSPDRKQPPCRVPKSRRERMDLIEDKVQLRNKVDFLEAEWNRKKEKCARIMQSLRPHEIDTDPQLNEARMLEVEIRSHVDSANDELRAVQWALEKSRYLVETAPREQTLPRSVTDRKSYTVPRPTEKSKPTVRKSVEKSKAIVRRPTEKSKPAVPRPVDSKPTEPKPTEKSEPAELEPAEKPKPTELQPEVKPKPAILKPKAKPKPAVQKPTEKSKHRVLNLEPPAVLESSGPDSAGKNYRFIDSGDHLCKYCNIVLPVAYDLLKHLQRKHYDVMKVSAIEDLPIYPHCASGGHLRTPPNERPWAEKAPEVKLSVEEKLTDLPCRGLEFMIPCDAFFCNLCKELLGDSAAAARHVKNLKHNANYSKYCKSNPNYVKKIQAMIKKRDRKSEYMPPRDKKELPDEFDIGGVDTGESGAEKQTTETTTDAGKDDTALTTSASEDNVGIPENSDNAQKDGEDNGTGDEAATNVVPSMGDSNANCEAEVVETDSEKPAFIKAEPLDNEKKTGVKLESSSAAAVEAVKRPVTKTGSQQKSSRALKTSSESKNKSKEDVFEKVSDDELMEENVFDKISDDEMIEEQENEFEMITDDEAIGEDTADKTTANDDQDNAGIEVMDGNSSECIVKSNEDNGEDALDDFGDDADITIVDDAYEDDADEEIVIDECVDADNAAEDGGGNAGDKVGEGEEIAVGDDDSADVAGEHIDGDDVVDAAEDVDAVDVAEVDEDAVEGDDDAIDVAEEVDDAVVVVEEDEDAVDAAEVDEDVADVVEDAAAIDEDAVDAEEVDEDAVDVAEVDEDAVDVAEVDEDAVDVAEVDEDAVDVAEVDEDAVDVAEVDEDAVDVAEVDEDAVDAAEVDEEAVDAAVVDEEAVDVAEVDEEAVDAAEVDEEAVDAAEVDEEAVDAAEVDEEAVDAAEVDEVAVDAAEEDEEAVDAADVYEDEDAINGGENDDDAVISEEVEDALISGKDDEALNDVDEEGEGTNIADEENDEKAIENVAHKDEDAPSQVTGGNAEANVTVEKVTKADKTTKDIAVEDAVNIAIEGSSEVNNIEEDEAGINVLSSCNTEVVDDTPEHEEVAENVAEEMDTGDVTDKIVSKSLGSDESAAVQFPNNSGDTSTEKITDSDILQVGLENDIDENAEKFEKKGPEGDVVSSNRSADLVENQEKHEVSKIVEGKPTSPITKTHEVAEVSPDLQMTAVMEVDADPDICELESSSFKAAPMESRSESTSYIAPVAPNSKVDPESPPTKRRQLAICSRGRGRGASITRDRADAHKSMQQASTSSEKLLPEGDGEEVVPMSTKKITPSKYTRAAKHETLAPTRVGTRSTRQTVALAAKNAPEVETLSRLRRQSPRVKPPAGGVKRDKSGKSVRGGKAATEEIVDVDVIDLEGPEQSDLPERIEVVAKPTIQAPRGRCRRKITPRKAELLAGQNLVPKVEVEVDENPPTSEMNLLITHVVTLSDAETKNLSWSADPSSRMEASTVPDRGEDSKLVELSADEDDTPAEITDAVLLGDHRTDSPEAEEADEDACLDSDLEIVDEAEDSE